MFLGASVRPPRGHCPHRALRGPVRGAARRLAAECCSRALKRRSEKYFEKKNAAPDGSYALSNYAPYYRFISPPVHYRVVRRKFC